jgi:transcriptional regulator with GAF, ATPase, and Fis domain
MERGVIGRTFKTGKTQLVTDVSADPDYTVGHPVTHSCLAVPMRRGGRVVGVLNLESDQLAAFDSDDVPLAESLAERLRIVDEYQIESVKRIEEMLLYGLVRRTAPALTAEHLRLLQELFAKPARRLHN